MDARLPAKPSIPGRASATFALGAGVDYIQSWYDQATVNNLRRVWASGLARALGRAAAQARMRLALAAAAYSDAAARRGGACQRRRFYLCGKRRVQRGSGMGAASRGRKSCGE